MKSKFWPVYGSRTNSHLKLISSVNGPCGDLCYKFLREDEVREGIPHTWASFKSNFSFAAIFREAPYWPVVIT